MTQGTATIQDGADGVQQRFLAVIKRDGLKPYVEIPEEAVSTLAGSVAVVGTIGRARFRSTLEPGEGGYRLFVDTNVRTRAGINVGDRVRVSFTTEGGQTVRDLPPELAEGLEGNEEAKVAYGRLLPDQIREILLSLKWAKTDAARTRYVKKLVRRLEKGWVA